MNLNAYIKRCRPLYESAQATKEITPEVMIYRYIFLPVSVARDSLKKLGLMRNTELLEDLISVGNTALMKAVHAYDPDKLQYDPRGFGPYAKRVIEVDVWDEVSKWKTQGTARAQSTFRGMGQVSAAYSRLKTPEGGEPTPEAIAKEAGLDLKWTIHLIKLVKGFRSLSEPVGGDDADAELPLGEAIPDDTPGPEELAINAIEQTERKELAAAVERLPGRFRVAVGLTTGYAAFEAANMNDILFAARAGNQTNGRKRLQAMFREGEASAERIGFKADDARGVSHGSRLPAPSSYAGTRNRAQRDKPADIWRRLASRWREAASVDTA